MEQVFLVVCLFLACCVVQLTAGLSVSSAGKKAALVWNLSWFLSSLWPMGGRRVSCDGLHSGGSSNTPCHFVLQNLG